MKQVIILYFFSEQDDLYFFGQSEVKVWELELVVVDIPRNCYETVRLNRKTSTVAFNVLDVITI